MMEHCANKDETVLDAVSRDSVHDMSEEDALVENPHLNDSLTLPRNLRNLSPSEQEHYVERFLCLLEDPKLLGSIRRKRLCQSYATAVARMMEEKLDLSNPTFYRFCALEDTLRGTKNSESFQYILSFIIEVFRGIPTQHSHVFKIKEVQQLMRGVLQKIDALNNMTPGFKNTLKGRSLLLGLCISCISAVQCFYSFLVADVLALEHNTCESLSPTLIWCLSSWIQLGSQMSRESFTNGHRESPESLNGTLTHQKSIVKLEKQDDAFYTDVTKILGKSVLLYIEKKMSMSHFDAFSPFFNSLTPETIEEAPLCFTFTVLRLLRRSPESFIGYLVAFVKELKLDLSKATLEFLKTSEFEDLLKNSSKPELQEIVKTFLVLVFQRTFCVGVIEQCFALLVSRFSVVSIRAPEKLVYLNIMLSMLDNVDLSPSQFSQLLQNALSIHWQFLIHGCAESNEGLRCAFFTFLGYCIRYSVAKDYSIKGFKCIKDSISDIKMSDRVRVAALKALCFSIDDLDSISCDYCYLSSISLDFIPVLSTFLYQTGSKPLTRLMNLLSLLALLRLERYTSISLPLKIKTLFTFSDSFLNSFSAIVKAGLDEWTTHVWVIREIFTSREDFFVNKDLQLFKADKHSMSLPFTWNDSSEHERTAWNSMEILNYESPYQMFFKSILIVCLEGTEKRFWDKFPYKIVESSSLSPSTLDNDTRTHIMKAFALAYIELQNPIKEMETPFKWSPDTAFKVLNSILCKFGDSIATNEEHTDENYTAVIRLLLTLILCHSTTTYGRLSRAQHNILRLLPVKASKLTVAVSSILFCERVTQRSMTKELFIFPEIEGIPRILSLVLNGSMESAHISMIKLRDGIQRAFSVLSSIMAHTVQQCMRRNIQDSFNLTAERISHLLLTTLQKTQLPRTSDIVGAVGVGGKLSESGLLIDGVLSSFDLLYFISRVSEDSAPLRPTTAADGGLLYGVPPATLRPTQRVQVKTTAKGGVRKTGILDSSGLKSNSMDDTKKQPTIEKPSLREHVSTQVSLVYYILDSLKMLCIVNPLCFTEEDLSLWVVELQRCVGCYLTVSKAYETLKMLIQSQVGKSQFPSSVIAECLLNVALKHTDLQGFLQCLQQGNFQPTSSKAITCLYPIFNLIQDTPLSLQETVALFGYLKCQLSVNRGTKFSAFLIRISDHALRSYPVLINHCEPLLTYVALSLHSDDKDLMIMLVSVAMNDLESVRLSILNVLKMINISVLPIATFLHVFACDTPNVKCIAQEILDVQKLSDLKYAEMDGLFSLLSCKESSIFSNKVALTLARKVNQLTTTSSGIVEDVLNKCISKYLISTSIEERSALVETMVCLCREGLIQNVSFVRRIFHFLLHSAFLDDAFLSGLHDVKRRAGFIKALETLGIELINYTPNELQPGLHNILQSVQDELKLNNLQIHPASKVLIEKAVAIFFGVIAKYAKPTDTLVKFILENLLLRIGDPDTPTRDVQVQIAVTMVPLFDMCCNQSKQLNPEELAKRLLNESLTHQSFVTRNGNSLAFAACVKGLGTACLRRYGFISKLIAGGEDRQNPISRQGAMLCFRSLSELLDRLFHPFLVSILKTLLNALSDSAVPVRTAAQEAVKHIMSGLSGYCVKLLLPTLLSQISDSQWRTKIGAIEALGAMSHCAPKHLTAVLAQAIPQLCEAAADANMKVKGTAIEALETIASVITNSCILDIAPLLLDALKHPGETAILTTALNALVDAVFIEKVDFASLSFIFPIVIRGQRERNAELKRKATAIAACMVYLCADTNDFLPYFPQMAPALYETLVDPIPNVRSTSARALGTIAKILDEDELKNLLSFLLNKLKTSELLVERSGAAHGLAEVLTSLGSEELADLLPKLLYNAEHLAPEVREGYLGIFVFLPTSFKTGFQEFIPQVLPVVLRGLASDVEPLRDVAFRAAEVLVIQYASTHSVLLLAPLEDGIFNSEWKIRFSSVALLGTLLDRLLKSEISVDEDEELKHEVLSFERRAYILSSLYMVRSDSNAVVRQQAATVWKSVVQNNAKTLKEILPILLRRVVSNLGASVPGKQEVAANCIGDLAQKFSDKVGSELVPQLLRLAEQVDASARYGGCIGLSRVIQYVPRQILLPYREKIIKAVQLALCERNASVQEASTHCLAHLVDTFGEDVISHTINSVIQDILVPPTYSLEEVNDTKRSARIHGVVTLFDAHHQLMLQAILQTCTQPPYDLSKIRLISTLTVIPQKGPFNYAVTKSFPAIFNALTHTLQYLHIPQDQNTEKSEPHQQLLYYDLNQEQAQEFLGEILSCSQKLFTRLLTFDGGVSRIVTLLTERVKENKIGYPSCLDGQFRREAVAHFFNVLIPLISVEDLLAHMSFILHSIIPPCLLDPSVFVVEMNIRSLTLLLQIIKQMSVDAAYVITLIRDCIKECARFQPTEEKSKEEGNQVCFPGLIVLNTFETLYAFFHLGFISYEASLRESAVVGLSELIEHSPDVVLKPIVVKITGPLIRGTIERIPASLKATIFYTLRIIIVKAGAFLRPLVPQLQICFCKALVDAATAVRRAALNGVSCLAELSTVRADPFLVELCQNAMSNSDFNIRTSLFQAMIHILNVRPVQSLSLDTGEKTMAALESVVRNRGTPEALRTIATDCYALLLGRQTPPESLASRLKALLASTSRNQDLEDFQVVGQIVCGTLLVKPFFDVLIEHQPTQCIFIDILERFLHDERLGMKRYGVIMYTRLVQGGIRNKREAFPICFRFLPLACEAFDAFVDLNAMPTLLSALQGLKSLAKHADLTLDQRIYILKPVIMSLSLPHTPVRLIAEKVLCYTLDMYNDKQGDLLTQLHSMKDEPLSLKQHELDTLVLYRDRVLWQITSRESQ